MSAFDITRLTPRERLDLIGELWDSLAAEDINLSPVQETELAARMATFDEDIASTISWTEIDANFDRRSA